MGMRHLATSGGATVKAATKGWIGITAVVIAADTLDEHTMSEAFREISRHRYGRFAIVPAWALLTLHLFGVLPPRYDPLHQLGRVLRWRYAK